MSLTNQKGCKLFSIYIINNVQVSKEDEPGFEDILIVQDFVDVFLDEITALPPKRDLYFMIELVP